MADEARAERKRVTAELTKLGRLNEADRAIIALHCETWSVYVAARKMTAEQGTIAVYSNGSTGPAPHYKVMKECASALRRTLADLGLTPKARNFDAKKDEDAGDLDF